MKSAGEVTLDSTKIYECYEKNMITKEVFDILMINNLKTSSNNGESVSIQSDEEIIDINAVSQQEEEMSTSRTSEPGEKKCRRRPYAQCHPDRPHLARGMCKQCYYINKIKRSKILNSTYDKHRCPKCGGRKYRNAIACFKCTYPKNIPQCHPDKPYVAKNMCRNCYQNYYNENHKAKNKISN